MQAGLLACALSDCTRKLWQTATLVFSVAAARLGTLRRWAQSAWSRCSNSATSSMPPGMESGSHVLASVRDEKSASWTHFWNEVPEGVRRNLKCAFGRGPGPELKSVEFGSRTPFISEIEKCNGRPPYLYSGRSTFWEYYPFLPYLKNVIMNLAKIKRR